MDDTADVKIMNSMLYRSLIAIMVLQQFHNNYFDQTYMENNVNKKNTEYVNISTILNEHRITHKDQKYISDDNIF